jgi:hypothetical protein
MSAKLTPMVIAHVLVENTEMALFARNAQVAAISAL